MQLQTMQLTHCSVENSHPFVTDGEENAVIDFSRKTRCAVHLVFFRMAESSQCSNETNDLDQLRHADVDPALGDKTESVRSKFGMQLLTQFNSARPPRIEPK